VAEGKSVDAPAKLGNMLAYMLVFSPCVLLTFGWWRIRPPRDWRNYAIAWGLATSSISTLCLYGAPRWIIFGRPSSGNNGWREGRATMRRSWLGVYTSRRRPNSWRFWGLYIHVCKMEPLHEAYRMAKSNKAAPGIDRVTFEAIGESGEECFFRQIRDELVTHMYRPMREPQHRNGPRCCAI